MAAAEDLRPIGASTSSFGEGSYYCALCEMWLRGLDKFEDHKQGRKHRRRTAATMAPSTAPAPSRGPLEVELREACIMLARLEQTAPCLRFHLDLVKTHVMASIPGITRALRSQRRTEFRMWMSASVLAMRACSRRSRRVSFRLAYWSGRIPHMLHSLSDPSEATYSDTTGALDEKDQAAAVPLRQRGALP